MEARRFRVEVVLARRWPVQDAGQRADRQKFERKCQRGVSGHRGRCRTCTITPGVICTRASLSRPQPGRSEGRGFPPVLPRGSARARASRNRGRCGCAARQPRAARWRSVAKSPRDPRGCQWTTCRLLSQPPGGRLVHHSSGRRPIPPVDHRVRPEERPRPGLALEQDAPVPSNLHAEQRWSRVELNQVDDASGFALETNAQSSQVVGRPGDCEQDADIEVAARAILALRSRSKQDGQAEVRYPRRRRACGIRPSPSGPILLRLRTPLRNHSGSDFAVRMRTKKRRGGNPGRPFAVFRVAPASWPAALFYCLSSAPLYGMTCPATIVTSHSSGR